MARPDRVQLTRRVQVAELGESGNFSVVAPLLNVRRRSGAEDVADALKAALGLGSQILEARETRRMTQFREDFQQGAIDATAGRTDAERRRKSDGYDWAASQVEAEALTFDDENELNEAAKDLVASGDVEGVRALLKGEFDKRWPGLNPDDPQAKVVVPWMAGVEARLTGEAQQRAGAIKREADVANLTKAVEQEARDSQLEGRPFDHLKVHAYARELLGKDANPVLTDALVRVYEKNPEAYASMPDEVAPGVPSPKYIPGLREKLEAGVERGQKLREDEQMAQRSADEFRLWQTIDGRMARREFYSERELEDGVGAGLITNAQARQIRAEQQRLIEQDRRDREARAAARQLQVGIRGSFDFGTWHGYRLGMTQADIDREFDGYVADAAARFRRPDGSPDTETGLQFIASASQRNGLVYTPLKEQLRSMNLASPERFNANLETFRQLYAISPPLARRYVPDEAVFDRYVGAMTHQDLGGDPRAIMMRASQIDGPGRAKLWREGDMRKQALAAVGTIELETPGSWFSQEVGDVRNKAWAQGQLQRLVEFYGETGEYESAEAVVEAARKSFEGRFAIVDDVVIPRTANMPENIGDIWDWFHEAELQRVLDAAGTGLKASQVELRPDLRTGRDRATFRLYTRDGYEPVLPFEQWTVDTLAEGWRTEQVQTRARLRNAPDAEVPANLRFQIAP